MVTSATEVPIETGLQALVRTIRSNDVSLIAGVYGDPCSALLDALAEVGAPVEISVEEKTAMAQALGASVCGRRSVVAIKHVGVYVAADPLVTAVTHGIGAAMVLIAGDDPGAAKSSNEQDSRWFGPVADIPVLSAHDPAGLSWAMCEAVELSESLGVPVMLHVTQRLLASEGLASTAPIASTHGAFDRDRMWLGMPLDRKNHFHRHVEPALRERAERSIADVEWPELKTAVISCGFASSLVKHGRHLPLSYIHPLSERAVTKLLAGVDEVLIVEDTSPVVEQGVLAIVGKHGLRVRTLGRLTGHLPRIGPLSAEDVAGAFERHPEGLHLDVLAHPSSAVFQLRAGGFEPLYAALDAVLPDDHLVAGDVGCSSIHGYLPPQVIDTAFALGTSIATAAGMSLAGKKGIAVVGDCGFVHSGITCLLNAVEFQHDILAIVLCNGIAAMTPGNQPIRGLARIRRLAEACGATHVREIDIDAMTADDIAVVLREALASSGVFVLLARARPVKLG